MLSTLVVVAGIVAISVTGLLVVVFIRTPWVAPWVVVPVFATSAELQLRTTGIAGVLKDLVVAAVVAAALVAVWRSGRRLRLLGPLAAPLGALAVVLLLYVANPLGPHDLNWLSSVRLVVEASGLLVAALVVPHPARVRRHLVLAVMVIAAVEAVLAWVQQLAGEDALVYAWGYQFGAQVRQTSSGGLRTSGTFAEPFALAALGVTALVLGLFLARGWVAAVLFTASVAIVAATSVRTAILQVVVVVLVWTLHHRWFVQAWAVGVAVVASALFAGAVIRTAPYPGGPTTPLLLGLNGRSTAWQLALDGPFSLVAGNGVAQVGAGSDRSAQGLVTQAATFDAVTNPTAAVVDPSTFLDSAYAQVQSDTGLIGTCALLIWLGGTLLVVLRDARSRPPGVGDLPGGPVVRSVGFGGLALLLVGAVDWFGRTTLFAFPTGFLLLYTLGVLLNSGGEPPQHHCRRSRPVHDTRRDTSAAPVSR